MDAFLSSQKVTLQAPDVTKALLLYKFTVPLISFPSLPVLSYVAMFHWHTPWRYCIYLLNPKMFHITHLFKLLPY